MIRKMTTIKFNFLKRRENDSPYFSSPQNLISALNLHKTMIWRFILLLVSWLLSESAAILVTYILGSVIRHFWGKSAMEIIKGKMKEEEDEED